jgi:hypothetical protein
MLVAPMWDQPSERGLAGRASSSKRQSALSWLTASRFRTGITQHNHDSF